MGVPESIVRQEQLETGSTVLEEFERTATQAEAAIDGRGAFRRFYDVIANAAGEHTRWQRYSDDARLGRARRWLADHGYQPATR